MGHFVRYFAYENHLHILCSETVTAVGGGCTPVGFQTLSRESGVHCYGWGGYQSPSTPHAEYHPVPSQAGG